MILADKTLRDDTYMKDCKHDRKSNKSDEISLNQIITNQIVPKSKLLQKWWSCCYLVEWSEVKIRIE